MIRRLIWVLVGVMSCLVGVVGLILPIIPGILFLAFGVFCFVQAAGAPDRHKPMGAAALRTELQWDRDSLRRRR